MSPQDADPVRLHDTDGPGSPTSCGIEPMDSESRHGKGRDCARTEEVLESYRRRAIKAELEVARLRRLIDGRDDAPED